MLIVFDDMIADMESNKKLSPIVNELFLRGTKLDISLACISQSYFKNPKTIRLNETHYFIVKIRNKRELQQIASSHSSDNDFKDFIRLLLKNYIHFQWTIQLYQQIIHYDLEITYYKNDF